MFLKKKVALKKERERGIWTGSHRKSYVIQIVLTVVPVWFLKKSC